MSAHDHDPEFRRRADCLGCFEDLNPVAVERTSSEFDRGFDLGLGRVNDNDQRCQYLIRQRDAEKLRADDSDRWKAINGRAL